MHRPLVHLHSVYLWNAGVLAVEFRSKYFRATPLPCLSRNFVGKSTVNYEFLVACRRAFPRLCREFDLKFRKYQRLTFLCAMSASP
jgi:hypothetical protein